MTNGILLLTALIGFNVSNYRSPCHSNILVHQHGSVVCIASKQQIKVNMSLHNLIGNPVHDWGRVELKRGVNIFDCSGIVQSRGIYILVLVGKNIHIVKKVILNS